MSENGHRSGELVYDEIPPLPPGWVRVVDHKEQWEKLREESRAEAHRLAKYLAERWNVKRVWLYGSVAGVWTFTDRSDIDLAVEGLSWKDYFCAWRDVQEKAQSKFRVDIRRREDWEHEKWNRLIPSPVLLYERK